MENRIWTEELTKYLANCTPAEREFLTKAIENSSHKADTHLLRKFIDEKLEIYHLLKFKGYKV